MTIRSYLRSTFSPTRSSQKKPSSGASGRPARFSSRPQAIHSRLRRGRSPSVPWSAPPAWPRDSPSRRRNRRRHLGRFQAGIPQQPRAGIDTVMREHAGRGGGSGLRSTSAHAVVHRQIAAVSPGRRNQKATPAILRQRAFQFDQLQPACAGWRCRHQCCRPQR